MVRSSAQASTTTATQQISRCSHLMVRRRYECVFQRVPARVCTHSMLLCVAHTAVQVPRSRSLALSHAWTLSVGQPASSADADSPM
jgi:hypothetical protein